MKRDHCVTFEIHDYETTALHLGNWWKEELSNVGLTASALRFSLGSYRPLTLLCSPILQTVQQQQRTEKDSSLAELEESRRILLRRLKDHRGKEWEVVHEALAFAGEPVEDRDDLPLPPYPMPLSDTSFGPARDDKKTPYNGPPATEKYNGSMKQLSFGPGHAEGAANAPYTEEADGSEEEPDVEEGTSFQAEPGRRNGGGGVLGIPVSFAKALFGFAIGVTSKVAIVAVSVAAALAVSEATRRLEVKETCSKFLHKRAPAPPPIATARQMPPQRECPPGKKLIMEDGYPKCVVKERVELPFYREVKTPDVLYGRG